MPEIRVLVVDDSAFLRRNIPRILESDSGIKVVGTAANGVEAIEMTKRLKPDVITLDVIMPVMDGLTALRCIMNENPTPVVMLSAVTYEGARQTMEALSLGAVDFINKPSGPESLDIAMIRREIVEKVKMAANAHPGNAMARPNDVAPRPSDGQNGAPQSTAPVKKVHINKELVAIAASTGGPAALSALLGKLPRDLPAGLVIVQHIAAGFTEALAERLDSISPIHVTVSKDFEEIVPGKALLAPAGMHLTIKRVERKIYAALSSEPSDTLHRPSANVLFASVAKVCGAAACAVIMTGMGDDGALGIRAIRDRGGVTIAQDEATSVIFGMPKEAIKGGGIDIIAPLSRIAGEIIQAL